MRTKILLQKSISLALLSLSLGGLVSCGKKVEDRPVAVNKPATTGAITKTGAAGSGVAIAPAGITIDTDLEQELSTGKNKNNDSLSPKSRIVLLVNIQP